MAWFSPPLEDPTRLVSFSCPKLDVNFGQCLRIGNVIEISGEAGSAKTQLCLDLTLQTLIVSFKYQKSISCPLQNPAKFRRNIPFFSEKSRQCFVCRY